MRVPKDVALWLLKIKHYNPEVKYPFDIMCKEYSEEDEDFVEVTTDDLDTLEDDMYQTFELWDHPTIYIP